MFNVNEYFDGRVKSIAFNAADGPATVGVMAVGEYTFGTSTVEYMTVVSGKMDILLPGSQEWKTYLPHETFIVPAGVSFQVKIESVSSYLCLYK